MLTTRPAYCLEANAASDLHWVHEELLALLHGVHWTVDSVTNGLWRLKYFIVISALHNTHSGYLSRVRLIFPVGTIEPRIGQHERL